MKTAQGFRFTQPKGPAATSIVIALILLWVASILFINRSLVFAQGNGQEVDTPTPTITPTSTPTPVDICARTIQVRDAILGELARLGSVRTCDSVPEIDLSKIRGVESVERGNHRFESGGTSRASPPYEL